MIKSKRIISLFVSAAMLITMLSSFATVAYAGEIAPDTSNDLLNETFDVLNTDIWGYTYMLRYVPDGATSREEITSSKIQLKDNELYMKTGSPESTSSYAGGFYGKFNKKVPLSASYINYDDTFCMTEFGKNTKLVATFKIDSTGLNTSKLRNLYFGFHSSSTITDATVSDLKTSPYGYRGSVGGMFTYLDNGGDNNILRTCAMGNTGTDADILVKGSALTKGVAYYKIEMTLTDENGIFPEKPSYTLSYRTSESDPWTVSSPRAIGSASISKLKGYLDCLYFTMSGSSSYIEVDDVNVYVTYDYETKCDDEFAYFYTPEDSDCFAAVAAYGSDNNLKDVITDDSLIRGVNKVSLDKLDTSEADYIKVFLWKNNTSSEPWCTSAIYELE